MILRIFPKGADGKLLGKIMAHSAELSIDKALERLTVSREKQKIIFNDVMLILPTGLGKSKN